jgi:hypothetical protein
VVEACAADSISYWRGHVLNKASIEYDEEEPEPSGLLKALCHNCGRRYDFGDRCHECGVG